MKLEWRNMKFRVTEFEIWGDRTKIQMGTEDKM